MFDGRPNSAIPRSKTADRAPVSGRANLVTTTADPVAPPVAPSGRDPVVKLGFGTRHAPREAHRARRYLECQYCGEFRVAKRTHDSLFWFIIGIFGITPHTCRTCLRRQLRVANPFLLIVWCVFLLAALATTARWFVAK